MSAVLDAEVDDLLWAAIGDPTRRRVIDNLLANGSGSASSISVDLPVSRQAVAKHLAVLERVSLVAPTMSGREKLYRIDQQQLARSVHQMGLVRAAWDRRLHRIKRIAEEIERSGSGS